MQITTTPDCTLLLSIHRVLEGIDTKICTIWSLEIQDLDYMPDFKRFFNIFMARYT